MLIGHAEVRGVLQKGVIDSNAFDEFSDLVAKGFLQTVDLWAWIVGAGVSFLESVGFLIFVVSNESDACDFGVLFSDKELSTKPFWLTVFVDVD